MLVLVLYLFKKIEWPLNALKGFNKHLLKEKHYFLSFFKTLYLLLLFNKVKLFQIKFLNYENNQ